MYIEKIGSNTYEARDVFCLSLLFKKDFEVMIEYFEQMFFSLKTPFYYHFPSMPNRPEVVVRCVKHYHNDYQIHLNLGSKILSEMNDEEFRQVIYELTDLPSQFVGHKVFFPPVKEIFKK